MLQEQNILNHSQVVEEVVLDSGEECAVRCASECEESLKEWIQVLLMDKEEVNG